jgi:hypothetical protein
MVLSKKQKLTNAGGGCGERKFLHTIGGNVNKYSYYSEHYGGYSRKEK